MPEINTSKIIEASADAVWLLLEDFGNIGAWWPKDGDMRIMEVDVEGDGIGTVRHMKMNGVENLISEKLEYLNPESKTWILSITCKLPPGMTFYIATGQLTPITEGSCRFDYKSCVATDPGKEEPVTKWLKAAYAVMIDGLEATARA